MEPIRFYSPADEHGFLSNFSRHGFTTLGNRYATSEHFFQSMKFRGTKHEKEVRIASSPGESAKLGRDRSKPLRKDWENVKDDVMRHAVLSKFWENEDIGKKLLDTDDIILIEHTNRDSYWGDGGNGSGRNMLGRVLMEVRNILKAEYKFRLDCHYSVPGPISQYLDSLKNFK